MREIKLDVTFHNPNSDEETVKCLIGIWADIALSMVIKEQMEYEECKQIT